MNALTPPKSPVSCWRLRQRVTDGTQGFETMEKHDQRSGLSPAVGYHWKAMDHLSTEVIVRYALRELPADETQQVEEHLATCPECEQLAAR